jgi:DNA-directed RNA polymerase specialized sigma24 family protein
VHDALWRLPPARREAWELHHVQGFSFAEIGRRLGIPIGAAKLRSSRATAALRALLGVRAGRPDA